jgi:phage shock protein A
LQGEVDKTTKQISNLQAKAEIALKNGDRDLALQLLREKQTLEANLGTLKTSLENAIQMTEQIKVAISREEERIRTKTAEAMALKTQWKQAQIENSINKALDGMTADGSQAAFDRASNKIHVAQSESAARTELAKGKIDNRIAALDDLQADSSANDELAQMEQRLGLAKAPSTSATTSTPITSTPGSTSALEEELAQLEAKVGTGGASTPPPA